VRTPNSVRIGRQVERQFEWDDDGLSPLSGGLSEASYSINERPTVLGQPLAPTGSRDDSP